MNDLSHKAKKLARTLRRKNRKISWRKIAMEYPPIVKPGTLCRIAKEDGAWYPKDRQLLIALGLLKERKHIKRKTIAEMNNAELMSLCNRSITRLNAYLASRKITASITWSKGSTA